MGKVGKIAQRVKGTARAVPCPFCQHPKSTPVLFYPERGKPRTARGCPQCSKVWHRLTQALLTAGVSL